MLLPSPLLIASWGQNLASNQFTSIKDYEPSLATLCATRNFTVYHLEGIRGWSAVNGLPAVDFSNHCSFPNDVFSNWPTTSPTGLSLLKCPNIGKDIATCQALGKKIILSIDPLDALTVSNSNAQNYAATVARNVWNIFLGGTSPYRSFGSGVVLDGIDLKIRNNNNIGLDMFVDTISQLMGNKFIFSVSPTCDFPNAFLGTTGVLKNMTRFNYIVPYFMQSGNICGYAANNPQGFWSSLSSWATFASSNAALPLALGIVDWPVEPWAQAGLGDYIHPRDFVVDNIVPRMKDIYTNFAGFVLQDASYDALNFPCWLSPSWTYSDFLYRQLVLPTTQVGNASTGSDLCLPPPAASTPSAKPTSATSTRSVYPSVSSNNSLPLPVSTNICWGTCSSSLKQRWSWTLTVSFILFVSVSF